MHSWKSWLGLAVLLCLLAACAPQPSVSAPVEAEPVGPEAVPTETTAPSPIPESTATETAETDACVDCHTDKDQLILTAKVEEEIPEESEGTG